MAKCKTAQEVKSAVTDLIAKAKAGTLKTNTAVFSCGDGLCVFVNNNTGRAKWRARIKGITGASADLGEYGDNRVTYKSARDKLKALKAVTIKEEQKKTECPLFGDYCLNGYIPHMVLRKKGDAGKNEKSALNILNNYLAGFKPLRLDEINRRNVVKTMKALDKPEYTKNYAVSFLSLCLDYACNCGIIESNPIAGIKKGAENPFPVTRVEHRIHVAYEDFASKVIEPLSAVTDPNCRAFYLMLILTGLRAGEARLMRWDWIDFKNKVLVIPADAVGANKHGRGNGKGANTVKVLTDAVCELLQFLKVSTAFNSEFVFQSQANDRIHPYAYATLFRIWTKHVNANGKVSDMHGVRNTLYTYLRENGYDWETAELALTHEIKKTGNDRAYDGRQLEEQTRKALTAWNDFILKQLPQNFLELLETGRKHPLEWG